MIWAIYQAIGLLYALANGLESVASRLTTVHNDMVERQRPRCYPPVIASEEQSRS